jgi:uncharacterized protein (DUF952 family)
MLIYKIATVEQWRAAEATGVFEGAPVDRRDGYIHFSTAAQVAETLARHFAGQRELLLIAVDDGSLGAALRWEVSRGGQPFPHLYAALPTALARHVHPIPVDDRGEHQVARLLADA